MSDPFQLAVMMTSFGFYRPQRPHKGRKGVRLRVGIKRGSSDSSVFLNVSILVLVPVGRQVDRAER